VASDEYAKEDARDFALWKAARPEDEAAGAVWDAPFGRGRPGWHLECSAMSQHYLGDTVDLHAGGVDLIFPHHEDEIAQSEAATGKPFVRTWLHGEFLTVRGTKMSKRYGNFLTARDLRENGVEPAAVRYLFGQTHYRKQLDWTDEALEAAGAGARRLGELRERLLKAEAGEGRALASLAERMERSFRERMDDDLDVPGALAVLMNFVREANAELDRAAPAQEARSLAHITFERVSGVLQVVPGVSDASLIPAEVAAAAEERARARQAKDWARADELRKRLLDKGFDVRDGKEGGYELRRISSGPSTT
jgi:cysteinyl-tRNA synthetase